MLVFFFQSLLLEGRVIYVNICRELHYCADLHSCTNIIGEILQVKYILSRNSNRFSNKTNEILR